MMKKENNIIIRDFQIYIYTHTEVGVNNEFKYEKEYFSV